MAKKRLVEREFNRRRLFRKYCLRRVKYKFEISQSDSLENRLQIYVNFQALPRNSSPTRLRNRCQLSGRSRGYYRDFGISRHFFRKLAHQGTLPGVRKSSWSLITL